MKIGNTDPYQKNGLCVKQKKMNLEGLNGGLPSSELDLHESERCEVTLVTWPPGNKGPIVAHKEKEQTFFVLSGTGWITVANETMAVKPGDVVFVPHSTPHTTKADNEELSYLCLNTIVTEQCDESSTKMFERVAQTRKARWEKGNE